MLTISHPLSNLPVGIGQTLGQLSKQISKLFFQMSVPLYSLFGQTDEERKAFFGGWKEGNCSVRLPSKALGCYGIEKKCFLL